MTILTIDEAANFLRVTKRTLYRRTEIPRVRIGHRLMFVQEDIEVWVFSQRQGIGQNVERARELLREHAQTFGQQSGQVDEARPTAYHRNPVFRLPSSRSA